MFSCTQIVNMEHHFTTHRNSKVTESPCFEVNWKGIDELYKEAD